MKFLLSAVLDLGFPVTARIHSRVGFSGGGLYGILMGCGMGEEGGRWGRKSYHIVCMTDLKQAPRSGMRAVEKFGGGGFEAVVGDRKPALGSSRIHCGR